MNDLSAFNAQTWDKRVITSLASINFMLNRVNREYEDDFKGVGDTVWVRTVGGVPLRDYTPNVTTLVYNDLDPTKEQMKLDKAKSYAIKLDDVDKVFSDLPTLDLYASQAAISINDEVERVIFSVTNQAYAANVVAGSAGAALTLDSTGGATGIWTAIINAGVFLTQQNVPLKPRWMVLDPKSFALIQNDTTHFIRASAAGDRQVTSGTLDGAGAGMNPGFMGEANGFDIYQSNNVLQSGGAKYLPFGADKAIAYASGLKETELIRLESSFATALRGLIVHGAKVFAEKSKQLGYIYATP